MGKLCKIKEKKISIIFSVSTNQPLTRVVQSNEYHTVQLVSFSLQNTPWLMRNVYKSANCAKSTIRKMRLQFRSSLELSTRSMYLSLLTLIQRSKYNVFAILCQTFQIVAKHSIFLLFSDICFMKNHKNIISGLFALQFFLNILIDVSRPCYSSSIEIFYE